MKTGITRLLLLQQPPLSQTSVKSTSGSEHGSPKCSLCLDAIIVPKRPEFLCEVAGNCTGPMLQHDAFRSPMTKLETFLLSVCVEHSSPWNEAQQRKGCLTLIYLFPDVQNGLRTKRSFRSKPGPFSTDSAPHLVALPASVLVPVLGTAAPAFPLG
jgi:hypothetical protein